MNVPPSPRVLIAGCGYSGRAIASELAANGVPVTGTAARPEHLPAIAATGARAELLDLPEGLGGARRADTLKLIAAHTAIVYAIGPYRTVGEAFTDHTLAFADLVREARDGGARLDAFVYLSSTGVYGNRGGAWVDEDTPFADDPGPRGRIRIEVERGLLARHAEWGLPVRILRLTGIYGPGRHVGLRIAKGDYKVVEADPPLVVNRIHVEDVAQSVVAALEPGRDGQVVIVSDGHPATLREVADYAAAKLGLPSPPGESAEEARARMGEANFHLIADSKRCSNKKLVGEWGVRLRYPDFRAGLDQAVGTGGSSGGIGLSPGACTPE